MTMPVGNSVVPMIRSWKSLLLLLAAIQATGFAQPDSYKLSNASRLACEDSGMCSLGKVQPFTGDIRPSPAMRACLEARSYRNEIILLTETRLNPAYQTFRTLLSLGYEHAVLLSLEERCAKSGSTWPRLGCVWSSQTFVSNTKYLLDRVVFLVRAARLGYSVLLLDSDVLLLRDVYSLLRAPPLANVTLATMRDGNGWINCGVVYVQRARPDGPAAYMLAEIVDRLERWGEQPLFVASRGYPAGCWDQQMYSDTLLSVLAGRPLSYGCWYRHEEAARPAWEAAHLRAFGKQETGTLENRHYMQAERHPWPPELLAAAPGYPHSFNTELFTGEMMVPNTRGEWPEELGGAFYPRERGPSSQAFMDMLKSDTMPLWPDPEDPSQADAGAAIKEIFSFLPSYLAESWSQGGSLGYWNPSLRRHKVKRPVGQSGPAASGDGVAEQAGQQEVEEEVVVEDPAPVALAHFVHVPGGATNKLTVKMASANWDWDVAHAAHPNRGVFFSSSHFAPLPYVLALDASLEQAEWDSEEAFAGAVLSLLRVAMEVGRAAAYPAPRCNISWMGGEANTRLPLTVNHGAHIPYAPAARGFSDLRCLWGGYLQYGCQAARPHFPGGLLAPEYDHLLDLLRPHLNEIGSTGTRTSSLNSSINSGSGATASDSAAHLTELGFSPEAVSAATNVSVIIPGFANSTANGSSVVNGNHLVVKVPLEVLQPPPPATAWDVTELATKLMQLYGGPGQAIDMPGGAHGRAMADGTDSAVGSNSSSSTGGLKPLVLVLPEVPHLTEKLGPRHELFKRELQWGEERVHLSCEWIRTGRPYRRRLRTSRRRMR